MNIFINFGVDIRKIILCDEYYDIAWIYIHRLFCIGKVKIEYIPFDLSYYSFPIKELQLLREYRKDIKVTIDIENTDGNRYVIYDRGQFDKHYIFTIMDHCEFIDNVVHFEETLTNDELKMIKFVNESLNFKKSKIALNDCVSKINYIKNRWIYNTTDSVSGINNILMKLDKLNMNKIDKMYFDIELIASMIIDDDIFFDGNSLNCTEYKNMDTDIIDNGKIIINPIIIKLTNSKIVTIMGVNIKVCNKVYVKDNNIIDLLRKNNDVNHKIRLKFGGAIVVKSNNESGEFVGKWIKAKKKKEKKSVNWLPFMNNEYVINDDIGVRKVAVYSTYGLKTIINIDGKYYKVPRDDSSNRVLHLV